MMRGALLASGVVTLTLHAGVWLGLASLSRGEAPPREDETPPPISWVEVPPVEPVEPPPVEPETPAEDTPPPPAPTARTPPPRTPREPPPERTPAPPRPAFTDFTAQVLTAPGEPTLTGALAPGVEGGTRLDGPRRERPSPVAAVTPAPPSGPALVAIGDLSRPPAPPDLGATLRAHYPTSARDRGETGLAVLSLIIGPSGRASTLRVVESSSPPFASACRAVLRDARWSAPLDREGHPVSTRVRYTCRFEIR